jgi:hypothetical protein
MQRVQCVLRTFGVLTVCGLAFGCAGADNGQPNENAAQINEAIFNPQTFGLWQDNPGSSVASDTGLPVCIAPMPDNTWQCGKFYLSRCRVNWGGHVQYLSVTKFLHDDGQFSWADAVNVPPGGMLPQAVIGDTSGATPSTPNTHVYVCEAWEAEDGLWHPGKWWSDGCAIEWKGRTETIFHHGRPKAVRILTHP